MPAYLTISRPTRAEPAPILGSRFVAQAVPIANAAEGLEAVAAARAEFPGATHHAWAWRLPPAGVAYRTSDDGEPRGSAGVPILKRIQSAELVGVLVVVTRWFGGTKLGVGGLMRAYGGAAAAALSLAEAVQVVSKAAFTVSYPYECVARVQALLARQGWRPFESDFGAEVRLRLFAPESDGEQLRQLFADATAGRARVAVEPPAREA